MASGGQRKPIPSFEKLLREETREFLKERAVKDENEHDRFTMFHAMTDKYPGLYERTILRELAFVDNVAASLLGKMHSHFGGTVFTMNLDGSAPYLDPQEPISRAHIERAAKVVGGPRDEIDETVRSLSEHMGWDITKGSGAR